MAQEIKQVEPDSKQDSMARSNPYNSIFAPRPDILNIYMNGFTVGNSSSDVYLVVERNGFPTAILNMPYGTAKTLLQNLSGVIEKFESTVGQPVVSMTEATEKMQKMNDNV